MSNDLNVFTCTARLTRDPQVRFIANGTATCEFGIAIGRKIKEKEEVVFVDCIAWGTLAEILGKYATKGRQVALAGRLQLDQWEDKQTGAKRSKIRVVAESVTMIGPRQDAGEPTARRDSDDSGDAEPADTNVPF